VPVLRVLFDLLRTEVGIDESGKYGNMLRSLSALKLSGSFSGAVYQERVLHAVLVGDSISMRVVSPPYDRKTVTKKQKVNTDMILNDATPAVFIKYCKTGEFSYPLYLGPASHRERESILQNPALAVFVAESQTFPSIDMTIAKFDHKTKRAILYHCSVSIDIKHFATSLDSKGHLPLDMTTDPPSLLRSEQARKQVIAYKAALLDHEMLQGMTVTHHYAVFDDNAVDLSQPGPTSPFYKQYYVLSTCRR
jgi:hypothetical protein